MKKIYCPENIQGEIYAVDKSHVVYRIKAGQEIEVSDEGAYHLKSIYPFLVERKESSEQAKDALEGLKALEVAKPQEESKDEDPTEMTWHELLKYAKSKGVYKTGMKKDDILKALDIK